MSDLTVRRAVTADAEAIVRTHHEAVWNTARHHYQLDVLEAWAVTLTDDSYEQVRQEIADAEMVVLVAESNSCIAGFGMIVPADDGSWRCTSIRLSDVRAWAQPFCLVSNRRRVSAAWTG